MWDKYDINSYKNIMSRKQQHQASIFKGCRRQGRNKKNPDRGRKHNIILPNQIAVFVEIRRTPKGGGKQLRYIRNIFPVENFIFDQA